MTTTRFRYHVFLSHNTVQKDWVRKLAQRLRDHGLQVFFDEDSIQLGEDIVASMERALRGSRHVLLVLSPEALASQWVALELSTSLYRDPGAAARTIIPILRADCDIPLTIARLRYLDARRDDDFDGQVGHLLKAIDRVPITVTEPGPLTAGRQENGFVRGSALQAGGTLRPGTQVYVVREADRMLSSWLDQENVVCTVWGPRQVGKSSLAVRSVLQFRTHRGPAAFIDLSGLGGSSLPQVLYGICRSVAHDLGGPRPDADPFLSSGFGPQQAFLEFLSGLGPRVLIAFDEVDYLRAIGELGSFFRALRALYNSGVTKGSDVRVLISTVLPPRLFLEDELSSPFNIGYVLRLGNFRFAEARLLFERGGVQVSDDDFTKVFDVTGGQPFLTHVTASLIDKGWTPSAIIAEAGTPDGPFAMHLSSLLTRIEQSPSARDALREFRAKKRLSEARARELIEIGVLRDHEEKLVYNSGAYEKFFERND